MLDDIGIVDAHMHLIDVENNPYPWLAPDANRPKIFGPHEERLIHNYLIGDFMNDIAGHNVAKSVHLQANWDHDDPLGETQWLRPISEAYGYPHGVVGFANLALDNVEAVLDGHLQSTNMRGIRHILNWHKTDSSKSFVDRNYMTEPGWRRGFALLEPKGLSFDMQIYHNQMSDALDLARSFPGTTIVLNHTGMPIDRTAHDLAEWATGMTMLAQAPNVFVKISGLGLNNHDWTVEGIRPIVLRTMDIFGIDRCLFASDFPVDKLFSSYDTLLEAFDDITADFSTSERAKFFRLNAERVYRI
jgi:predicted TIM-barrel fold metal-dependent hydrolase